MKVVPPIRDVLRTGAGIAEPSSRLNKIQLVIGEKSNQHRSQKRRSSAATTSVVLCYSNRPGVTPRTVCQTWSFQRQRSGTQGEERNDLSENVLSSRWKSPSSNHCALGYSTSKVPRSSVFSWFRALLEIVKRFQAFEPFQSNDLSWA
jgi:hypothetical protein